MLTQTLAKIPGTLAGYTLLLLFFLSVGAAVTIGALVASLQRACAVCCTACSLACRRAAAIMFRANASRAAGIAVVALAALLATACEQSPGSGPGGSNGSGGPALAEVRYLDVNAERVTLTRELPGRISAFKVSEVRPQVGGIIQTRLFEEGADVEAGQVLYQIDPALYQAAYNNAKANLGRAEANEEAARLLAERYTSLVRSNSVSRQERDDAVAAYRQLRAEIEACRQTLESAAINLGYTTIIAPVSGRIGRSSVTEGALVTQNQNAALATIQQISPVYVDVTQSSAQMLRLKRALASGALQSGGESAARVRLLLEDGTPYLRPGGDGWLEGNLLFSDISVDESTGSVSIRARFDNPEGLLLPGMYVRAVLVEGVMDAAVLVPQRAVTRDNRNRPQVYVLTPQDNPAGKDAYQVTPRAVEIDRDHEGRWLLASGLAPGERLLVDGLQKVRPGQTVTGTALSDNMADTAVGTVAAASAASVTAVSASARPGPSQ